jgi:hypothetical protein
MIGDFPEKSGSRGKCRVRKSLKRQKLLLSIFPEERSSWESMLLLVFSPCGVPNVGFGFAAAANPILANTRQRPPAGGAPDT